MTGVFARYTPQAVCVPAGVHVERSFAGFEIGDEVRARCDGTTIFYDVFRVAGVDEVVCVGPPFLDLGYPRTVRLLGRRRRFVVEELRRGARRASILRIVGASGVGAADAPGVDLRVEFPEFEIDVRVRLPRAAPMARVPLTLITLQKDNELQWLDDWCTWHHRVHGVGRFVFYDNGSADRDDVYAELASRNQGAALIVVDWDYLYGPPVVHELKFAKPGCLNHCRLLFGPYTDWCINLDVDEYLCNARSGSLASYLGQVRGPRVYLPSYIVPDAGGNGPRRCFDSPFRSASLEFERRKYLDRPARTAFNGVHDVVARRAWLARAVFRVAKRVLRGFGVRPARLRATAHRIAAWRRRIAAWRRRIAAWRRRIAAWRRRGAGQAIPGSGEPTLFFFHFRALNTGWKYPRRIVAVGPDEYVQDDRIGTMRVIRDGRIAAMRGVLHAESPGDGAPV